MGTGDGLLDEERTGNGAAMCKIDQHEKAGETQSRNP